MAQIKQVGIGRKSTSTFDGITYYVRGGLSHVLRDAEKGEIEGLLCELYGCSCRSIDTYQCGRVGNSVAAAADNPEVEALVEVESGYLGTGAEDGTAGLTLGKVVPCLDLGYGEVLPGLRELLEDTLDG